ncbi:MAG: hypothetical protein AAFV88_15785 [Planctomycetota bacterium]
MGFRAICLLIALTLWNGSAFSQQPLTDPESEPSLQPYIVFVSAADSHVRCGPGTDFYRTEPLRRGQELEVYVETESGWLGVRPLPESFCWMPADDVEISADRKTASVKQDGTVAWIGTGLGQARKYRWQVELNVGEELVVLGENTRSEQNGESTWLRIAPPSGEFRWIHRNDIVETAEQLANKIAQEASRPKPTSDTIAMASHQQTKRTARASAAKQEQQESSRRQKSSLAEAESVPELRSILNSKPLENNRSMESVAESSAETGAPAPLLNRRPIANDAVPDKAVQFHRGARAEDYADRGAVIGSGLKEEWQDETAESLPVSGARAAAAAIAKPIQEMSNVVANFISPPRLVEIGPSRETPFESSVADQRWSVGGVRSSTALPATSLSSIESPPISLASASQTGSADRSIGQAVAIQKPKRVVSIASIARVEDAMRQADADVASEVLSKLMAETASADEIDPLIRRLEALLQLGDVNQATRLRELLQRSQNYRNLAARRDGTTVIQTSALGAPRDINASPATTLVTPALSSAPSSLRPLTTGPVAQPSDVGASTTAAIAPSEIAPKDTRSTVAGSLVQVYSSRPNSPPYALTDESGLTIAYVTPYPGVNLRPYLNSRVTVRGREKMLQDLSIPHILVEEASRR